MKVGTDALLLGAWAEVPEEGAVLDIGAGSGILSLMVAQRTSGSVAITGIELDPDATEQAAGNAAQSPWQKRIAFLQGDVLSWQAPNRYDMIISNPPFFSDSLGSPKAARQQARHADSLPFHALIKRVTEWLTPNGQFSFILPVSSAQQLIALAEPLGWHVRRHCAVQSTPDKTAHRWLVSLVRQACTTDVTTLTIKDATHAYSAEYRALLRDFYLRF